MTRFWCWKCFDFYIPVWGGKVVLSWFDGGLLTRIEACDQECRYCGGDATVRLVGKP